jgi:sulfane dehydrogenase subunit SoxC
MEVRCSTSRWRAFHVDFDWNGQELMIQSRAMDSTAMYSRRRKGAQGQGRQFDLSQQWHQTWLALGRETENVEIG